MANEYLDKTGLTHFWDNIKGEIGNASDAQVDDWLDRHPEATTTVQDGAITTAKLANSAVTNTKLADGSVTDAKLVQSGGVLDEVGGLKRTTYENSKSLGFWTYDLTSESYVTEITGIYVKTGDVLNIEIVAQSNANIAVLGSSNSVIATLGNIVFTADMDGYIRFYYKSIHAKINFATYILTSESGNSEDLIASQSLACKNDAFIYEWSKRLWFCTYDLTSESYVTKITDIYVKTGDVLNIEIVAQSNANIAVVGSSNTVTATLGSIVFTADMDGYIRFYYKSIHAKINFATYIVTSESGNSEDLIASQSLACKNDAFIDNYFSYEKDNSLIVGHYFLETTIGASVTLSGYTNNWVYSGTPLFVESGKTIHCITRASGICCIAKSSTNDFSNAVVACVADDNSNAKEYTYHATEDSYFWCSGRVNETEAWCDDLSDITNSVVNATKPKEYIVDINGSGEYTSFTDCLTALAGNTEQKIIYVKEGTYDIYNELGGAAYIATITDPTNTNWRDVQPVVPRNTKIVGQGNVLLTFNPEADVIGSNNMAFLFSPLNVDSDCEIENISIECTNCRYAIHIESSSIVDYNDSVLKFKNLRCKKTRGTYGTLCVCGTGIGANQKWEFDSCSFEGDIDVMWSVHVNIASQNKLASVIMNNCVFNCTGSNPTTKHTVCFVSSDNQQVKQNIAKLNNCYTNGIIFLENNGTKQQWDVTLLGCEYAGTGQSAGIVDNPYPIKEY